ncbi:hypothetical protein PR202_gb02164 [Eleusine coracana subsp. coracana]|uniref:Uncharacterized protein n=1 Tax=Eleusine coracana subsp. coracana TaxID=191504 RepID=A0AAV5DYM2_ELECO|nr:hypothetical protein PR202_gb02164 [Eleusine coracana subsp. coracana]
MDRAADGVPDVCRDQNKPTGTRATGVAFAGGTPLTEERERIWSRGRSNKACCFLRCHAHRYRSAPACQSTPESAMDRAGAADAAPAVCRDQSKPTGTRATGVPFACGTPLTEERERIWPSETPPYGAAAP